MPSQKRIPRIMPAHHQRANPRAYQMNKWNKPATRTMVARATGFKDPSPSLVFDFMRTRQSRSRRLPLYADVYETQAWDQANPKWFDAITDQDDLQHTRAGRSFELRDESRFQNVKFLAILRQLDRQPSSTATRSYVGSLIDVPNPSPSTVHDVLDALIEDAQHLARPRKEDAGWAIKLLTTENPITGLDHSMPGGLNPQDTGVTRLPRRTKDSPPTPDGPLLCKRDWEAQVKAQPNRVLNLYGLLDEGFFDADVTQLLPSNFFTTVHGLDLAVNEARLDNPSPDAFTYALALMRRGGWPSRHPSIVYPEDLIPFITPGQKNLDAEFWNTVQEHARDPRPDMEDMIESGMFNVVPKKKRKKTSKK